VKFNAALTLNSPATTSAGEDNAAFAGLFQRQVQMAKQGQSFRVVESQLKRAATSPIRNACHHLAPVPDGTKRAPLHPSVFCFSLRRCEGSFLCGLAENVCLLVLSLRGIRIAVIASHLAT
jgi:hypothetical protein